MQRWRRPMRGRVFWARQWAPAAGVAAAAVLAVLVWPAARREQPPDEVG